VKCGHSFGLKSCHEACYLRTYGVTEKQKTDEKSKAAMPERFVFAKGATAKEISDAINAARHAHGFGAADTVVKSDTATTKLKTSRIVQVNNSEGGTIIVGGIATPLADKETKR